MLSRHREVHNAEIVARQRAVCRRTSSRRGGGGGDGGCGCCLVHDHDLLLAGGELKQQARRSRQQQRRPPCCCGAAARHPAAAAAHAAGHRCVLSRRAASCRNGAAGRASRSSFAARIVPRCSRRMTYFSRRQLNRQLRQPSHQHGGGASAATRCPLRATPPRTVCSSSCLPENYPEKLWKSRSGRGRPPAARRRRHRPRCCCSHRMQATHCTHARTQAPSHTLTHQANTAAWRSHRQASLHACMYVAPTCTRVPASCSGAAAQLPDCRAASLLRQDTCMHCAWRNRTACLAAATRQRCNQPAAAAAVPAVARNALHAVRRQRTALRHAACAAPTCQARTCSSAGRPPPPCRRRRCAAAAACCSQASVLPQELLLCTRCSTQPGRRRQQLHCTNLPEPAACCIAFCT